MNPLSVYLRNHWMAARVGLDLAERVADSHRSAELREPLSEVARQIREDREALREIMAAVDVSPAVFLPQLARVVERVARLKPNGRLVRRSPVSDVIELESLRSAVQGKRAGWEALLVIGRDEPRLPDSRLEQLLARADDQLQTLGEVHRALAGRRLAPA